ncbi:MAG TPA: NAD(P)/FAD-dependent oxidoreductase [Elusimicrobiota bacterium]|nr:NAD(P)/FAD-dependent oxidoreductase [Elusimicrobiota bacterium]
MAPKDVYDVTIIGGGPVGLYAAYYAGFRALRVKIIDSLAELGGQVTALYPEKMIRDVAGFPGILGKDLVRNLAEQAFQYKPVIGLSEQVQELTVTGDKEIRLLTDKGEHFTRVVLITAGIGMFTPRKLPLPEADRFEGKGLFYWVKHLEEFRGKRILVVGGGDSAVDWVLGLLSVAKEITLVHRRDVFRAHEDSVRKMMDSSARIKTFHEVKSILGRDAITGAVIFNNKTGQEETVSVDTVVACLGFLATLGPLETWGLELDGRSVKVNFRMETNRPGIYAAGDMASYPGKVKLIATGFGEAATAVNNAAAYINPKSTVFPGHSTEKKQS